MARITQPPDWQHILTQDPKRWIDLLTLNPDLRERVERLADSKDGYLHWTKFRHKQPFPSELTHEEGWGLVRTQRLSSAKPLPFRAKCGTRMVLCMTDPLHAAVRRITAHRELLLAGLPEQPNAQLAEDMKSFGLKALIDEAYYSAVIEGAVTTRREARKMIREKRTPLNKSEWMVLNNFRAGQQMTLWAREPMTPKRLCEIQEILTANTLEREEDAGQFRADIVEVQDQASGEVVHVPPPAEELPQRMQQLCDFANHEDSEDPIPTFARACLLHYQLAYDHPFGDGNGRTARWLFLWRLLRCPEYWWVGMLSVSRMTSYNKQTYYDAFRFVESDNFDTTYLVRHQTQAFEQEMERFTRFLTHRRDLASHARAQLRLGNDLNVRQLALFDQIRKKPQSTFTQQGHAQFHGVSQPTARKDLENLAELDLLTREKGRPIVYRATPRFVAAAQGFDSPAAH